VGFPESKGFKASQNGFLQSLSFALSTIEFNDTAYNLGHKGSSVVACVRARLALIGGERGHSKSGTSPVVPPERGPHFLFFYPMIFLQLL
jgi:hypothetical protein